MTTEQLIEKLRKSGLEEVDAFAGWEKAIKFLDGCSPIQRSISNKCLFKINNDKFIEIRDPSLDRIPTRLSVIFWHSAVTGFGPVLILKQKKDTICGRLRIYDTCTPDEFEEHFTRFLNA